MKKNIYLDDIRVPLDPSWVVVTNFDDFIDTVLFIGFDNINIISLDHDLGKTAMIEYYKNVSPNYILNYNNIEEKTGLDCAKWLVNHYYDGNYDKLLLYDNKGLKEIAFPRVYTHSANPIGSANIMGYINNFLKNEKQIESCVRIEIPFTIPQK